MADIYVKASGSNTSPYDTWAKAATSLATAVTQAAANDRIYVDNTFSQTGLSNTTYSPAAGTEVYSTSDTTNQPPTTYASGAAISTTTSGTLTISSGSWFGFAFSIGSGANSSTCFLASIDNGSPSFESCTFALASTVSPTFSFGVSVAGSNAVLNTRNCSFSFASTGASFNLRGCIWYDVGSNLDAGATHPLTLFKSGTSQMPNSAYLNGSDLSANANTLFGDGGGDFEARIVNCKLNASVTIPAAWTVDGTGEVWVHDSDSGDNHYVFAHYCYRGSTVVSVAKYVTADGAAYDGTNRHSFTVTGAHATFGAPYFSPWVDQYTSANASVTPYFEVARDGSTTAYNNNEVWAEFLAKVTSSSTRTTLSTDRMALLGTAAAQATGAGTGAWTGLSGTAWSGKCDSGSAFTPAEIGYVRGRIVIATNATVQVDPKIRGL